MHVGKVGQRHFQRDPFFTFDAEKVAQRVPTGDSRRSQSHFDIADRIASFRDVRGDRSGSFFSHLLRDGDVRLVKEKASVFFTFMGHFKREKFSFLLNFDASRVVAPLARSSDPTTSFWYI